ncbi:hypothetical protein TCE0_033f09841 [Talaromyces pinophilus]|uniref:Uncharacterized protein n=1 Tax=Talaromyces pinophilus TaxID=128442 RepID=A0A6V8HE75_TALPI|nr:hypothetical protein TCE0_033f09841 [Talaromyces pinophilus]
MVFYPPPWVPKLPGVPDTVSIPDFLFDEQHGRRPLNKSWDPFTCGLSGRTRSAQEHKTRVDHLARALNREFGWKVNEGTEYDKVISVFAFNTIDIMTVNWAVHRNNGISSPVNSVYNADELVYQLTNSGSKGIFTVLPLLQTALTAARKVGIPKERIYLCEMPDITTVGMEMPSGFKTLSQLILQGASLPPIESLEWTVGQGARQTAFLCYSSGTSGQPKGVMISHRNVIANILQIRTYDQIERDKNGPDYQEVALGLLPQSHIYGLIVICHVSVYRGDQVIVLPKFDIQQYLNSISKFKINVLYIVPPIIISMVKNKHLLTKFDLSSVKSIFTAAAPLGKEVAQEIVDQYPDWKVRQAYGLTETCTAVTLSSPHDIWFGSSGSLLPGCEAKLMTAEGNEITGYNQPGELWIKSPSVVLGYLKNAVATKETFVEEAEGRFMRTGDEAMFRKAPSGNEHVWIVDRMKELIKVKGMQVAPAELEACLLEHPAVADCAVIAAPDHWAGEVPKAYVVRSNHVALQESEVKTRREIRKYVEGKKKSEWEDSETTVEG